MSRRAGILQEMGLGPVWTLRQPAGAAQPVSLAEPEPVAQQAIDTAPATVFSAAEAPPPCFNARADDDPADSGVDVDVPPSFFDDIPWAEADAMAPVSSDWADSSEPLAPPEPPKPDVAGMDWEQLEQTILQCNACGLCQNRTQAVPGVGDRNANWLFVGEGPGFVEDQQGEPFVGPSGKLLDNMLLAMGLKRGANAYIANIVKCRPTDDNGRDRPPSVEEAALCRPYLERQIALIQPEIIVALGKTAATMLLGSDPQASLASLRGKLHRLRTPDGREIPLVATYHPAYLLRQLPDKKKAWADLCLAMQALKPDGNLGKNN
ncbi:MAG: uracil-DNA glycosylase protein [Burkholderiaceae bacterium]|nr:uracil-DNA glycosylase protein [Burkholderiaceae bacterium]